VRLRDAFVTLAVLLVGLVFLLLSSIGGGQWAVLVLGEFALFLLALGLLPYGVAAVLRWTRRVIR
jgi:hypothetical protein